MITLYVSIVIILFAFFISQSLKDKKQVISNLGVCAICDRTFKDQDIFEEDTLSFCSEHFTAFKTNKWNISETVECSVGNEQASVDLFEKKKVFYNNGVLGYLKPSYRLDGEVIITILDYYQLKE
jgi:hypothetical protein